MRETIKDLRSNIPRVDMWLVVVILTGAVLRFGRLGNFHNEYYTAVVASMLESPSNFFFGSFDPGGIVMVDKPPVSFWVQAIPSAIFGVSEWTVTVPQAIVGTVAIGFIYMAIRPVFGRLAAVCAGIFLAVLPSSVVIDSRNEPDSLLSFTLLIAALSMIRAVRTNNWRWLIVFSILMGVGFNIKMLVAFVPLPAFILYYLIAADKSARHLIIRAIMVVIMISAVSISWMSVVALTPTDSRPWVGSTRDNSIWTLAFSYNGLDRFTSFRGPRQRANPDAFQANRAGPVTQSNPPQRPMGLNRNGTRFNPADFLDGPTINQNIRPAPFSLEVQDIGMVGMLRNPLAGQLGWLLPLSLFSVIVILVPMLTDDIYKRPVTFFETCRGSKKISQSILWIGWLVTATVIFGLADATSSHPYYLVGVAIPLVAVLGIGLSLLWDRFRVGGRLGWLLPITFVGCIIYQIYGAHGSVAGWVVAMVLVISSLALMVVIISVYRSLTSSHLAMLAVGVTLVSILVIPLVVSFTSSGRIVGRPLSPIPPGQMTIVDDLQDRIETISSYIGARGDSGSVYTIAAVNAREAAPFIIDGIPAFSIGGFSGSDPIFTEETFRNLVKRDGLRYFLMPSNADPAGARSIFSQDRILKYIGATWRDVSVEAGLPSGTLYRYHGRRTSR